jgi:hypothetical protein
MEQMQSHKKVLAVLVSLAVAIGIVTAATASAERHGVSVTGFPTQINQVDLDGYKIVTSYPLGNNIGNTFLQTYADHSVSAFATKGPDVGGGTFLSTYIALPVGHNELFVTWLRPDGSASDVFLMNFNTGIVSDVAPPNTQPISLGTVRIDKVGIHPIP